MIIQRPLYLDKLKKYKDSFGIVKILTGIRRCGKSTLFKLYTEYLLQNGVEKEQIININLEDPENRKMLNWEYLYDTLNKQLLKNKINYIFIDEVQNVNEFQRAINGLRIKDNVDLYVTGSNGYLLSGELATLLSGRYIKISIQPLSFKEYVSVAPNNITNLEKFNTYLYNSSFPNILLFNEKEQINEYLNSIYESILFRDIIVRKKIVDVERLKKIVLFIFDNIGSLTSINNIKKQMASEGFKVDVSTIENYLTALIDSFILYKVGRYDIKGKQFLQTNDKYYVADIGLRRYLLGVDNKKDRGHILENIVYLQLLREEYRISIGKVGTMEIDFVAEKNNEVIYFQVCETMLGEETRERELKVLRNIKNNYRKIILTMDYFGTGNYDGIEVINIMEWLLK